MPRFEQWSLQVAILTWYNAQAAWGLCMLGMWLLSSENHHGCAKINP